MQTMTGGKKDGGDERVCGVSYWGEWMGARARSRSERRSLPKDMGRPQEGIEVRKGVRKKVLHGAVERPRGWHG
jgi:hypothetical protein